MVKYLVEKGAGVKEKDYFEKTALIYAFEQSHLETVKYLFEMMMLIKRIKINLRL
jgi:ankyrin repeat protein